MAVEGESAWSYNSWQVTETEKKKKTFNATWLCSLRDPTRMIYLRSGPLLLAFVSFSHKWHDFKEKKLKLCDSRGCAFFCVPLFIWVFFF